MLVIHKLLTWAIAAAMTAAPDKPVEVMDIDSGSKCQIEMTYATVAWDRAEWERLWARYQGPTQVSGTSRISGTPAPPIDFKESVVLAFFAGAQSNIAGFEVDGIESKGKKAVVRLRPLPLRSASSIQTTAYVFLQLTRPTKPIELMIEQPDGQYRFVGQWSPPRRTAG
jgi:hypothetical protein